jgi:hypothetical protein
MADPTVFKVSVLATNELLLDGQKVTLAELEQKMDQSADEKAAVWYYRENAANEAPPVAKEVLKLITAKRLPIRLSSKPDFSDTVTPVSANVERLSASIREKAAQRQLVILRPDGQQMLLAAMAREASPPNAVAFVERLLPSSTKRNIAVIADTAWTMTSPSVQAGGQAIPFFGILMGFASIGHAVWIFDAGAIEVISALSREADVLIVDSARIEALPGGWQSGVISTMRNPQILVYDRATGQVRKL